MSLYLFNLKKYDTSSGPSARAFSPGNSFAVPGGVVPTTRFLVFQIAHDVRNAYAKKNCRWNPSGGQLLIIFVGGISMSGLKWNRVGDSPQQKWISKNLWQEMERVDESKIVPNRYVFVLFLAEKLRKRWRSSKSGYCSSTYYLFFKLIGPQRKRISKNRR